MTDDLKALEPCPFCGGNGCAVENSYGNWRVLCHTCRAAGDWRETREKAIAAWNTRAPDPRIEALEAEVKRLREALKHIAEDRFNVSFSQHRKLSLERRDIARAALTPNKEPQP